MASKEDIMNILRDVKPLEAKKLDMFKYKNISVRNFDPPGYIVRMVLIDILGLKDYGRHDKVNWHTYLQFKNINYMVRDYKFGSWSIESDTADKDTCNCAEELKKKILIAENNIDKILYDYLKQHVEQGNYYIKNLNDMLSSLFDFYLNKTQESIEEVKKLNDIKEDDVFEKYNKQLEYQGITFSYAYSMIHAFYSYLEFILDVIYAFESLDMDLFDFRNLKWNERFKLLFKVQEKKIEKIYVELLDYKTKYRNPLSHGLTNEISVLVPMPHAGLIPLSYQFLSNEIYYGAMSFSGIAIAEKTINTFGSFFDYLSNNEPYNYYMKYIEAGFEIPIIQKDILVIKKQMTSPEDFDKYLEEKGAYMDALINRDI
jgi:hypothetical protein